MVIVILGILAATALPRFIDLSASARTAAAKGSLGSIRAALAIQYAQNAVNNPGSASYPSTISSSMFADNNIPNEPYGNSNSITFVTAAPSTAGSGWAYDSVNGRVWLNNSAYTSY